MPKNHLRIEAYGTVDELNAHLGLLRDRIMGKPLRDFVKRIQDELFTIGSNLAADPADDKAQVPGLDRIDIEKIEEEIDRMTDELPPLKNFILPGGHPMVSQCHVTRCVCRRTERRVVALSREEEVNEIIVIYLNRLSDYLFVLARYLGQELGVPELIWKNPSAEK